MIERVAAIAFDVDRIAAARLNAETLADSITIHDRLLPGWWPQWETVIDSAGGIHSYCPRRDPKQQVNSAPAAGGIRPAGRVPAAYSVNAEIVEVEI